MYKKKNPSWLKHWDFEVIDIVFLELGFVLAYLYRHMDAGLYLPQMYLRLAIMLFAIDLVVSLLDNNYKGILQRSKSQELWAVTQHITIVELLLLFYEFSLKETEDFSRTVFILSWLISMVLCFCGRVVWKKIIRKWMTRKENQSKMLLVASEERVVTCVNQLRGDVWRNFLVSAVALPFDTSNGEMIQADIPLLFGKEQMLEYARQGVIDEVFIDTYLNPKEIDSMVDTFLGMGMTVHIGLGFLPENLPNRTIERIGSCHVMTTAVSSAASWQLALKRAIDIAGALVGLLFTGIELLFVGPAIKIASPGPVFFKQDRVGKNGRIFHIYKFRTMYMDAEERKKELMAQNEMEGFMFKMENDPRIIGSEKGPGKGLGNFLRKTSLDEFPQFLNVLMGDMSLVGTRPPTKDEYEKYDLHHKIRLSMKPGITGLWQTSGRSQITDFEQVVALDTEYIENWSVILDIKILLKTVYVVVARKGSK